ncbi:MAG: hypothetical protein RDV48_29495 [Candidatus Eremiobacteraeota bacterium]|nr:hypothetical protein [Candidatus Eremiobacteraeota bacterium]
MSRLIRKLLWIWLIALLVTPAWAAQPQQSYFELTTPVQWTQVPGVPQVLYAPGQNADIFQYGQQYYYLSQSLGKWYTAPSLQGSWVSTQNIPQVFYQIPQTYFKNPSSWNQGNTTTWGDASMQPWQLGNRLKWSRVPGAQEIQYVPGQNLDIFQYGQQYYYLSQGQWYNAPSLQSSWVQTQNVPQAFYQIPQSYFKNPPGWAQGNKTGWSGASLPPGLTNNQFQWSRVPGTQQVYYAPGQSLDIFRFGQQYYYLTQGQWYNSPSLQNSWVQTRDVPQAFYQIPQNYFKNSNGWNQDNRNR